MMKIEKATKHKKEIDENEWECAINRAADYILRHPSMDISLFILLKNSDDERFMRLDPEETKRFLKDIAGKISYKITHYSEDKSLCVINYDPGGAIKECKKALLRLIEENGFDNFDAIKEELRKQNYSHEVIVFVMQFMAFYIMKKNKTRGIS